MASGFSPGFVSRCPRQLKRAQKTTVDETEAHKRGAAQLTLKPWPKGPSLQPCECTRPYK